MLENCRMMDMNKDSHVDLNEFLEAFRLCQQFQNNSVVENEVPTASSSRCLIKDPEDYEDNEKAETQVDEYEISEMKEMLNVSGQLKKSSSVRSVVSVESLSQTGKVQNEEENQKESSINQTLK